MDFSNPRLRDMVDDLVNRKKEDYMEFSKYFFRGFANKKILKIAEETYGNYKRYGDTNGSHFTNDEIHIKQMLKEYSKMDKKTRKYLNDYQLTFFGLQEKDKFTSLSYEILILMAYCKKFDISEIPLVDKKKNFKKFNFTFKNIREEYIDEYIERYSIELENNGEDEYPFRDIYINPKLIKRIIFDVNFSKFEDYDEYDYIFIHKNNYEWWNYMQGNHIGTWNTDDEDNDDEWPKYQNQLIGDIVSNFFTYNIEHFSHMIGIYSRNEILNLRKQKTYKKFSENYDKDICVICQEEYINEECNHKMVILQCGHILHRQCFYRLKYEEENGRRCPMRCYEKELWNKSISFQYNHSFYDYYNYS